MTVTRTPTISATMIVRGLQQQAAVGQREPNLVEEPAAPSARPRPSRIPTIEASRPTSASISTALMIWRLDAPIVRSVANLAGPLRNGDRQRVGDHERADEQRDAAEGEQESLEEAEEALRLARILVGSTFSGAYLGAGRQDGLNRRELRLGRALGRGGTDLIELKVLVEQLPRGGQVERGRRSC